MGLPPLRATRHTVDLPRAPPGACGPVDLTAPRFSELAPTPAPLAFPPAVPVPNVSLVRRRPSGFPALRHQIVFEPVDSHNALVVAPARAPRSFGCLVGSPFHRHQRPTAKRLVAEPKGAPGLRHHQRSWRPPKCSRDVLPGLRPCTRSKRIGG